MTQTGGGDIKDGFLKGVTFKRDQKNAGQVRMPGKWNRMCRRAEMREHGAF